MNEPTTLVKPHPPEPASGAGADQSWALPVIVVLVDLGLLGVIQRRGRNLDARERAFRGLCQRMGLTRRQIGRVRQYARARSVGEPVAVLMSSSLLDDALRDA